jgi:pimeloyl-ACP methyl ester carboxylesterase
MSIVPKRRQPIVIIGGFLTGPGFYSNMARSLAELSDRSVHVCRISLLDWLGALTAKGWLRILFKVKSTVDKALKADAGQKIILLGHSAGGVVGRLYLSPHPFLGHKFSGLEHVTHLITLGSPHYGTHSTPMRKYVQRILPDAFFDEHVQYVSIAGTSVDLRKRAPFTTCLSRMCYRYLGGNGRTVGDGLVPVECALLKDSKHILLEGVGHPFLFATNWYGTPENVSRWWPKIFPPK